MKTDLFPNLTIDINTLWIGIGNTGRSDDGLGWAFLDLIEQEGIPGRKEYRYHLQIEDADLLRSCDRVIFIDSSREVLPGGFAFHQIGPREEVTFTTHALSPETVLALSRNIYGHHPEAWMLAIEGSVWEIGEGLSDQADRHLELARENLFLAVIGLQG